MTARDEFVPPKLSVWVTPGYGWGNPPDLASGFGLAGYGEPGGIFPAEWVELTLNGNTRLLGFDWQHGRADPIDQVQPGSGTIVLDNSDGFFDGFASTARAGTTIRVVAEVAGSPYGESEIYWQPVFTGLVEDGWHPSGSGKNRTVTVGVVDAVGWAASVPIPSHPWTVLLSTTKSGSLTPSNMAYPAVWWQGQTDKPTLTPGAGTVKDFGSAGIDGQCGTTGKITVTKSLLGERDGALRVWEGSSIVSKSAIPYTPGDAWSFGCWVQVERLPSTRYLAMGRAGSPTGGPRWSVGITATGAFAEVRDAAGSIVGIAATVNPINDGRPHLIFATFDPSNPGNGIVVYVDTVDVAAAPWPATAVGGGGWLRTGSVSSPDPRVIVDSIAYWDRLATFTDYSTPIDDTDFELYNFSTWGQRLGAVARTSTPWPFGGGPSEDTSGPWGQPSSVADAWLALGPPSTTSVACTRDGELNVLEVPRCPWDPDPDERALKARGRLLFSDDPDDVDPPAVDYNTPLVVRYASAGTTGETLQRVINEVRTATEMDTGYKAQPSTGAIAQDQASIGKYGPRTHTIAVPIISNPTQWFADDLIDQRSEPTRQLPAVTVRPWGNATATWAILDRGFVGTKVSYHECVPGTTTPLIDHLPCSIEQVTHSWQNGIDWTVTFTLAPLLPARDMTP